MKVLFIGGTGTISTAISALAVKKGMELYLLNRGNRSEFAPEEAKVITADINDAQSVKESIKDLTFDVIADFIAFSPAQVERDYQLFKGKTAQYIFISSASAYQKPLSSPYITESTPLSNPFWQYSRDKIACEEWLMDKYRKEGFPVTLIRPSHTYGNTSVPVAIHGNNGSFSVIERIRQGKKVLVHGDGGTLWTLTYNEDFAKAFVGIMGNTHAIGETYQITSDESLTWNQIYEIIGGALGVKPQIVHLPTDVLCRLNPSFIGGIQGDKAHTVIFDNTKIKRTVPGFAAEIRFDQGVRKALNYIYSHEACQKPDPSFDNWTDRVIEAYEKAAEGLPLWE